jgi:hypothetical protein
VLRRVATMLVFVSRPESHQANFIHSSAVVPRKIMFCSGAV